MKAEYFEINLIKCDKALVDEVLDFFIKHFLRKDVQNRARLKLIDKPDNLAFDMMQLAHWIAPKYSKVIKGQEIFPQILAMNYKARDAVYITASNSGLLSLKEAASVDFVDALLVSVQDAQAFYFNHHGGEVIVCQRD